MSVTFTPLPAGTMSAAAVLANFALLRTWISGGAVTADLTAANVRAQHIFRPDTFGFPVNAQHRASDGVNACRVKAGDSMDLRSATRRIDLIPAAAGTSDPLKLLPDLGVTFQLWGRQANVVVTVTWSAVATKGNGAAAGNSYQGYFVIQYRERSGGGTTTIANSRRQLQTATTPASARMHYSTQGVMTLNPGVWDVWLAWYADAANADAGTASVVCGHNAIMLQTHRNST